jgi:putative DNA primase/helicase
MTSSIFDDDDNTTGVNSWVGLKHTKDLNIATGESRQTKQWRNKILPLSDFVLKLATPVRTPETLTEYMSLPKSQQDEIKDVGGFVGGHLKGGRRGRENVQSRHIITLDADFCEPNFVAVCAERLSGVCYSIYSTHKHRPNTPRLRLVVYPDRALIGDEYQAVARRIARLIGINQFDDSTYDTNRLMYWPSCSSDGEFVHAHNDAPFLDVAGVLGEYGPDGAWTDATMWPRSDREHGRIKSGLKKQGNPLEKKGLVGAFCKVYNVHQAIESFLGAVYHREKEDRYTLIGGSTSGGLVIYEAGLFAYSNHSTDPCYAMLCNAYDLVRVHLFGDQDADCATGTPVNRLPSAAAMREFLEQDTRVDVAMYQARTGLDGCDAGDFDDVEDGVVAAKADLSWVNALEKDVSGAPKPTLSNAVEIVRHDAEVNGRCRINQHSMMYECCLAGEGGRRWADNDLTLVRDIIGKRHKVDFSRDKIESAIFLQAARIGYHPVKEYLFGLGPWDGIERIERLFIDYFDAEDSVYVREVARCWMIAAVQRVIEPGCKFDNVPVIGGRQGIGKTQFIERLCPNHLWYGELSSFDPKVAQESMLGKWLMEIGEMRATNRHDLEQQKSFLSARVTTVRMAYARNPVDFLRQCVFIGTTNQDEYLKDSTGNRRWWPIEARREDYSHDLIKQLEGARDMLWAEALCRYASGEGTELSKEALRIAEGVQESKREGDELAGLIEEYLNKPCSEERYDKDYMFDSCDNDRAGQKRDRVCVLEIAEDILGIKDRSQVRKLSRRIASILNNTPGWKKHNALRFGDRFGVQKAWVLSSEWEPPF